MSEPQTITCPVCGMTSYHPEDVRQGYCGNCHDFTSTSSRWFDRQGRQITVRQANELLGDIEARIVAKTWVGEQEVSTVHLVLDHRMLAPGPPLIFETMVFPECDVCERTPTEAAALAMHDQVVADLRTGRP